MGVTKLLNIFNSGTSSEDHGLIEISGVFKGAIHKGFDVLITPPGRFYGEIQARNVEIAGMVQGDVEAESMVIHSSGQLYYDKLKCQHLSVKDGGTMVNMGEKESEKLHDVSNVEYPINILSSDYIPEGTVENQAEPISSNEAEGPDNANCQINREDISPFNDPRSDYDEAKPVQQEIHTLQTNEQKPLCDPKQPRFYSSY